MWQKNFIIHAKNILDTYTIMKFYSCASFNMFWCGKQIFLVALNNLSHLYPLIVILTKIMYK